MVPMLGGDPRCSESQWMGEAEVLVMKNWKIPRS